MRSWENLELNTFLAKGLAKANDVDIPTNCHQLKQEAIDQYGPVYCF